MTEIEKLRADLASALEALKRVKIELAALVPEPREVSIDTWPLPSSADRYCVDAAYRRAAAELAKHKEGKELPETLLNARWD